MEVTASEETVTELSTEEIITDGASDENHNANDETHNVNDKAHDASYESHDVSC